MAEELVDARLITIFEARGVEEAEAGARRMEDVVARTASNINQRMAAVPDVFRGVASAMESSALEAANSMEAINATIASIEQRLAGLESAVIQSTSAAVSSFEQAAASGAERGFTITPVNCQTDKGGNFAHGPVQKWKK